MSFELRLEESRKKLLDLTRNNKMINYKRPKKSLDLHIIDESPQFIFNELVKEEKQFKFKAIPEPEMLQIEQVRREETQKLLLKKTKIEELKASSAFDGEKEAAKKQLIAITERLQEAAEDNIFLTAKERAEQLGYIVSSELPDVDLSGDIDDKYTDEYLQTLHYPGDLARILKGIDAEARGFIEETGVNMCHIILGMLEWRDRNDSTVINKSPLVCIPVVLKKGTVNRITGQNEYTVSYTQEGLETNRSLAEKLLLEHDITLPELEDDLSYNEYLKRVSGLLESQPNWKIKNEISIDFLNFTKILMYKDLEPKRWKDLAGNQTLSDIFIGSDSGAEAYDNNEYDIDAHEVAKSIPLIMNADSSQHSAIVDILKGKSIVIEGPPGTGKSQTLSNAIAALMAQGKSVLFVSEKLAALEVVFNRLSVSGLGDFCLELHSNKVQKQKVFESLAVRINNKYEHPSKLNSIIQKIEAKKAELKEYIDTLHLPFGASGLTIFDLFWKVERYHDVSSYLKFEMVGTEKYTDMDMALAVEALEKFKAFIKEYDFESFYWSGCEADFLSFVDIDLFLEKLKGLEDAYRQLAGYFESLNSISAVVEDEEAELSAIKMLFASLSEEEVELSSAFYLESIRNGAANDIGLYLQSHKEANGTAATNALEIQGYASIADETKRVIASLKRHEEWKKIEDKIGGINQARKYIDTLSAVIADGYKYDIDLLDEEGTKTISSVLSGIDTLFHHDANLYTLQELENLLSKSVACATDLLGTASSLCEELGIEVDDSYAGIVSLLKASELIATLPIDDYRHLTEEFGTSPFGKTVEQAKHAQEALGVLRHYADSLGIDCSKTLPKSDEIRTAKDSIAQGIDSFFSFLSSDFRRSKRLLAGMYEKGELPEKQKWISAIEAALQFASAKESFESDPLFRRTFGMLFKGDHTNWDTVNSLSEWARRVRNVLKSKADLAGLMLNGDSAAHKALQNEALKGVYGQFESAYEALAKQYGLAAFHKRFPKLDNIASLSILKETLYDVGVNIGEFRQNTHFVKNSEASLGALAEAIDKYFPAKKTYAEKVLDLQAFTGVDQPLDDALDAFYQANSIGKLAKSLTLEIKTADNLSENTQLLSFRWGIDVTGKEEEINSLALALGINSKIIKSRISHSTANAVLKDIEKLHRVFQQIVESSSNVDRAYDDIGKYASFSSLFFRTCRSFKDRAEKLSLAESASGDLPVWLGYRQAALKLSEKQLTAIPKAVESGALPKDAIVESFYYNFYHSLLRMSFRKYPVLANFSRISHEKAIEDFRALDAELIELNRKLVASLAAKRDIPVGKRGGTKKELTEMQLINNECFAKKSRHIRIRQLVNRAPKALVGLKPCFMMSPLSVSQYLPPNEIEFDVLLVDEASQMRPEEALGVIARAKQVVIIGDPKQLPPTAFFQAGRQDDGNDSDDEDSQTIINDSESILDRFISMYKTDGRYRQLKWHYRSQHHSLIDYSNDRFYEGSLVVFPSPVDVDDDELGVKHTYINGAIYYKGTNKLEAKVVVEHICHQMKNFPNRSLGVGTFNTQQRDLIRQLLDEQEKTNPAVTAYLAKWQDTAESFFIKNLESLQGDERDAIFISTTYGPDKDTKKVMRRFGPLNQENGWRRLNVLITRSKQKMHVFTSMHSHEIIGDEDLPAGARHLKGFLRYLETGSLVGEITPEGLPFDSDFEESVYKVLLDAGIKSVPQVGVKGYKIDLAVQSDISKDFTLAIECDGATYHSSKSARDRDRLKQEVLEGLGWKVYRIWSTDWFKNRDHEVSKLISVAKASLEIYREKFAHKKPTSPLHQTVTAHEVHDHRGVDAMVQEAEVFSHHADNIIETPSYEQAFVSDAALRDMLEELRDTKLAKQFPIDNRCVLSPVMIDQFLLHKPNNMETFRQAIPVELRERIDRSQIAFLNDIFEIVGLGDE